MISQKNDSLRTNNTSCENLLQATSLKKSSPQLKSSKSTACLQGQFRTIDKYIIIQELGKGAFATVYLVKDEETSTRYALKTLDKHFLNLRGRQEEAQIERNFLVNYKHPLFIELYRTFSSGKNLCFLLEYIPNKTLQDLIENVEKIPFDVAMYYANRIIEVISYMHNEINFVHRDLKPHNIMIDNNLDIKLIDFSSVCMENTKYNIKTRTYESIDTLDPENVESDLVGTCEYCAPEMYNKTSQYSKSNDIWAIGCILYQLFGNGQTPFKAFNNTLTIDNIIKCSYRKLNKFTDDFNDLLDKIFTLDYKARIDINGIKQHKFFTNYSKKNTKIELLSYKDVRFYYRAITHIHCSFASTNDEDKRAYEGLMYDSEEESEDDKNSNEGGYTNANGISLIPEESKEESKEYSQDDAEGSEGDDDDILPPGKEEFTVECYELVEDIKANLDDLFYYKEYYEAEKQHSIFEANVIRTEGPFNLMKTNCKLIVNNDRSLLLEKIDETDKKMVLFCMLNDNLGITYHFDDRNLFFVIYYDNKKYNLTMARQDYEKLKLLIPIPKKMP